MKDFILTTPTKAQVQADNAALRLQLAGVGKELTAARAVVDELTGIAALKAQIQELGNAGARVATLEMQLMQLLGTNNRLQFENDKLREAKP